MIKNRNELKKLIPIFLFLSIYEEGDIPPSLYELWRTGKIFFYPPGFAESYAGQAAVEFKVRKKEEGGTNYHAHLLLPSGPDKFYTR